MNAPTSELKRKIMMKLAKDPKIFELIDNRDIDPETPDDLIYNNIFPYTKVDHTVQEVGTYICIKLDYPKINRNEIYKNAELTFFIICNTNCMKVRGGFSRTDVIGERIIEMFDWNSELGFRIELVNEAENPIDENFYYRRLIFRSVSPNGMKNGNKVN